MVLFMFICSLLLYQCVFFLQGLLLICLLAVFKHCSIWTYYFNIILHILFYFLYYSDVIYCLFCTLCVSVFLSFLQSL
jgi:hypothetical protein